MDDETLLARGINAILTSRAFERAWEECKGTGVGSEENFRIVQQLFRDYDFIDERIRRTRCEIVESAVELLATDLTRADWERFAEDTLEQLIGVAVAHFITGVMVGGAWALIASGKE